MTSKSVRKPSLKGLVRPCVLRSIPLLAILLAGMWLQPQTLRATPVSSPPRVLILDETVLFIGTNCWEVQAAQAAIPGCAVDICSAANWYGIPGTGTGGPTGFGFDQYRAIIIGDPQCNTSTSNYLAALTALNATKAVWTPAAAGNVILLGVDNVCHAWTTNGAAKTINRGIAFAVNDPTRTGFYYALSCYYDYTAPATNATLVPHLTGFGTFMTRNYPDTCFNDAHIVATHPVFTTVPPLTDAELSNWGCSTHEGFDVWPSSFVVLAIALTNGTYTATDGSNGVPYILVRGEGVKVITTIELGPPTATNNIGTTHTVCATLATNVFPKANVPVTFTISSGPNAVTNYTTLTDSNGVACFTYMGNGGLGVDYITASYMNDHDQVITSGTVTKLWQGACVNIGCQTLECLNDGTWIYNFCITNLEGVPLTALSLFNPPAGVSFTPNYFNLVPPLGIGQGTNLSVTINGPITLSNICFKVGTYTTNEGVLNCSIPNCLNLPACCNRVITNSLIYVSTVGLVSTYNYSITIQNVTGSPLKFVGFGADQSCVTFLPPLLDLTLPAYGGSLLLPSQTRTLNLQVKRTAPCPGTNTFHLSTFDTNLIACCSTKVTLPPPKCVKIISPYDGSVMLIGTPVLARAIAFGPCGLRWVKFYDGPTYLGDAAASAGGGYELTLDNLPAGVHQLSAVAELESGTLEAGEIETSDPVELMVLAPGPNPDQDQHHDAPVISAGVTGDTILLSLPTAFGHQYEVEYRTNLVTGDWKSLQTIVGDGSVKVITDSVTNDDSRFYRVMIQP
jgi:hypothetical protein